MWNNIFRFIFAITLLAPSMTFAETNIINYDFNTQSFGVLSHGTYWSMQSTGGMSDSPAVRLTYSTDGTDQKALSLDVSSYESDEYTIEFDVKIEGTPSGGSKFIKFFGDSESSKNNMTLGMDYYANTQKKVAFIGDTLCEADYDGTYSGGSCSAYPPNFVTSSSAIDMRGGTWGHYKAWVKRASSGVANGEIKVWWNGILRVHINSMNSAPIAYADPTPGFYVIELGGYNNSNFSGTPWYLWIDNLSISHGAVSEEEPPSDPSSGVRKTGGAKFGAGGGRLYK